MNEWTLAAVVLLAATIALLPLPALRPAVDGLVVLELASALLTAALLLLAEGTGRQPFVDLALIFAALSFIGSIAFARLLERRV